MKALIIGGGIGGLAAGIALVQAGVEVHVFERAPQIREVGAGIALWSNALKALDKLSVGATMRAIGVPNVSGGIHDWRGGWLMRSSITEVEQRYGAPALVMHRVDLLNTLLSHFDRESLHTSAEYTSFVSDERCVTARFADGREIDGDMLIGADGIRSVVRQQLLPKSQPRYAGYTAWRAVVPFDHAQVGEMWGESWGRGARFGLAPLKDRRVYWFAVKNAPEGEKDSPGTIKKTLLDTFSGWHKPIAALIEAADESLILRNDIYDITPLSRWGNGRVTLLGDAAHATTPNLGQGACQALEDAVVLGECVKLAGDVSAVLRAYAAKRIPRTRQIIMLSRRIGAAAHWTNPLLCALRDSGLRLLPHNLYMRQLDSIVGYEV